MSNLMPSAKSGSHWTMDELLAFNIEIQTTDAATFFNTPELPAAPVSETILNNIDKPDGPLSRNDRLFFRYLKIAQRETAEECYNFSVFLLRMFNYDDDNRIIHFNTRLSFYMVGQLVDATPDICVMDEYDYVLVVQGNQNLTPHDNPEPQLIASSIAAFYQNYIRREKVGLPPPQNQIIAGIMMVGTVPIFYRIPVSQSLLDALVTSSYPKDKTVVFKCIPPVPDPRRYLIDGMRSLKNRRIAFQCLEAFKIMIMRPSFLG